MFMSSSYDTLMGMGIVNQGGTGSGYFVCRNGCSDSTAADGNARSGLRLPPSWQEAQNQDSRLRVEPVCTEVRTSSSASQGGRDPILHGKSRHGRQLFLCAFEITLVRKEVRLGIFPSLSQDL
jgi:hypothetical protein